MSSFGVYVIQLRSCPDRTALGALYVGSSWYEPSERLRQHNEGHETGAVGLRDQCRRLRPELYLDLPWHWDRATIFKREHERARRLAEAGFHVRCDGRVHSPGRSRQPFTEDELALVGEQFDWTAGEILAAAVKQLSLDELVRLLRWTASEDTTIAELISVPNEEVGRFSHVDEKAVRNRSFRRLGHRLGSTL